jgi:hypothetical protein
MVPVLGSSLQWRAELNASAAYVCACSSGGDMSLTLIVEAEGRLLILIMPLVLCLCSCANTHERILLLSHVRWCKIEERLVGRYPIFFGWQSYTDETVVCSKRLIAYPFGSAAVRFEDAHRPQRQRVADYGHC